MATPCKVCWQLLKFLYYIHLVCLVDRAKSERANVLYTHILERWDKTRKPLYTLPECSNVLLSTAQLSHLKSSRPKKCLLLVGQLSVYVRHIVFLNWECVPPYDGATTMPSPTQTSTQDSICLKIDKKMLLLLKGHAIAKCLNIVWFWNYKHDMPFYRQFFFYSFLSESVLHFIKENHFILLSIYNTNTQASNNLQKCALISISFIFLLCISLSTENNTKFKLRDCDASNFVCGSATNKRCC